MKILKWTNKYSGEVGYVKNVSKTKGYFVNEWDRAKAKSYMNETMAQRDLAIIVEIGEAENNIFTIEDK